MSILCIECVVYWYSIHVYMQGQCEALWEGYVENRNTLVRGGVGEVVLEGYVEKRYEHEPYMCC